MGELVRHPRFTGRQGQPEPWVTKQMLAGHLQVSCRTLDRWTQAGMPYTQLGMRRRYRISEAEAWLETQTGHV